MTIRGNYDKMKKNRSSALLLAIVMLLTAILAGCGVSPEDKRTVLTIDGKDINHDEYSYVYGSTLSGFGDDADPEKVKNEALDTLKNMYAIYGLAEKYEVKLNDSDNDKVKDYIKSYKDSFESEEKYLEYLKKSHMTEWSFKRILELNMLWEKLYNHITSEASGIILADDNTVLADSEKNFYRATYIFIEADAKNDAEDKALAESLAERAASGEDFFALVNEYGEDPNMTNNTDGRYFTSGELLEFFEEAVKSLEVGEISGVTADDLGYYVIKRLPIEREYVLENINTLRESYMARLCNEMVEEYQNNMEVTFTELYHSFANDAE